MQMMEKFLCQLLWRQLQSMGWFTEKNVLIADVRNKTGLLNLYNRWLEESIEVLKRNDYIRCDGEVCTVMNPVPVDIDSVWKEWDQTKKEWLQDPDKKAQILLVEAMLRALPDILTGKVRATDIMFPNSSMELVEGIYKHNRVADFFNEVLADTVVAYVQERIQQDPSAQIRILEIGAGTGGTSAMVLRKLKPHQAHIQEYCYTDISKAFLLHAEKEYGPDNPFLTYRIFNVEKPITNQGIAAGGYDLVVASNVLHATKNIRQTLRNTKAVLKKNGLILLNEMSSNTLFTHLTFGLLEGWWLYEDSELRIPGNPGLYPKTWQAVLGSEGFRSVFFPAKEARDLGQQIIVAESDGIVYQKQQPKQKSMPVKQSSRMSQSSVSYKTMTQNKYLTSPQVKTIKKSINVTDQMVGEFVKTIIRESIAEALRMEDEQIRDDLSFSDYGVDSIIAVNLVSLINKQCHITLQTTVLFDYNNVAQLTQYIIKEHKSALASLLVGSISDSEEMNIELQEEVVPQTNDDCHNFSIKHVNQRWKSKPFQVQNQKFGRDSVMIGEKLTYHRVIIERPGEIDDLRVIESEIPEVKDDEVRVAVRAFSLNFGDLLCVKGLYPTMPPYPFTPGFEASGIVIDVGNAVTSFKSGDEVIVLTGKELGGQANMITCSAGQVFKKPEGLSFEEACALPSVSLTMIDAFHKAKLKKGEKILIQTATGGTGLIAIQLAQYYGAEIYATAGSQYKLDYLKELGVPHLINYQKRDFEVEINRLTDGKGVDVIINTLPGDAIQKGLNCLSPGGRYIEIAMTALKSAKTIDLSVLSNNQTFYSVDLMKLALTNPAIIEDYRNEMIKLVQASVIRPTIYQSFSLKEIKDAYKSIENRKNIGKVVVTIPEAYQFTNNTPISTKNQITVHSTEKEPIAIIGMSGRFAKSKTVKELWEHLSKGTDLIEEVSRWELLKSHLNKSKYCNYGSFLEDIDQFDPLFFNIAGIEATYMDPQQRIFLEESWKALEDAGYAGTAVQGCQCGVYVGCSRGDYQLLFGDNPPAQAFWGNSSSVIPARIAYYLDLQGPAVAIDTACSSSLVAIHLACQSLWAGEIEIALSGGIFVQSTPDFYLNANRAGMLSPTGRCHTFDERADGFVPGEGVGVVVLKRLKDAVADGDYIYGLISGSGINQDGTTNGITAPSANSQERLETKVYDTFNINPAQIQMVEAHGTGTRLGDPIEYQALTRAFRRYTDKEEYCAIGSIKTNLGHTATAAGIAGLIKILLSLQHKQIPPSLHFQFGNSNIQFEGSPFYINTSLKDWDVEPNSKRRATVSSFGFSGTNAHMVIEEAPQIEHRYSERPGYLIVLSARSSQQLCKQAEQLVDYCEEEPQINCGNMSFTLLLGRKHFKHRLACVVRSQKELVILLRKWLETGKGTGIYVSEVNEYDYREQPSLRQFGNDCIQNCKTTDGASDYLEQLSTVADLYVQGYGLQFEELFSNERYSRIPLPTYPFSRERYWVPKSETNSSRSVAIGSEISSYIHNIHPLVQQNTSDFSEQRFSSTFTGDEFFIADHVVRDQPVLPGVAYLEMVRAAVTQAIGTPKAEEIGIRLENVVWTQPIILEEQLLQVHIGLFPDDNGKITYEIYSGSKKIDSDYVIHSQGRALLSSVTEIPILDLKSLQNQCSQSHLSSVECYKIFKAMGIKYGPRQQGIEKVYVGQGQILAKLSLPLTVSETIDQYVLHPSLMDSALQASIGLLLDSNDTDMSGRMNSLKTSLPFALDELEIFGRCTPEMWAFIRYSEGSQAGDSVEKLDIDLCDEAGTVCVRMKGFSSRVLGGELQASEMVKSCVPGTADEPLIGTVMLSPVWDTVPKERSEVFLLPAHQTVIVGGTEDNRIAIQQHYPNTQIVESHLNDSVEAIVQKLETLDAIDHIVWIAPDTSLTSLVDDVIIDGQNQGVLQVFRMVKALLRLGYGPKSLDWTVLTVQAQPIHKNDRVNPTHASLHGFIGSMAKEYSNWKVRLIDMEADTDWPLADIFTLPPDPQGNAWVYRGEEWHRQRLIPVHYTPWDQTLYKPGGVYVVIGGAGGIGEVWSEYMIRTYQAQIVWIGRRGKDKSIQNKIDRLAALGPAPVYIAADATDQKALQQAYEEIKAYYPKINGLIHSAIVLSDRSLAYMEEEKFRAVLAAKVDVSVRMAQAFQKESLDFVLFFSSLTSYTKAPGQSNYAAGCTFKDVFAHQLSREWTCAIKVMNWGYWGSVGIVASEFYQDKMASEGFDSIESPEAMEALETLLTGPMDQIALIKTTKPLVMEGIDLEESITVYPEGH